MYSPSAAIISIIITMMSLLVDNWLIVIESQLYEYLYYLTDPTATLEGRHYYSCFKLKNYRLREVNEFA